MVECSEEHDDRKPIPYEQLPEEVRKAANGVAHGLLVAAWVYPYGGLKEGGQPGTLKGLWRKGEHERVLQFMRAAVQDFRNPV